MKWYLDGILISSDYLTAPGADSGRGADSGAMIGARPGFGGFRPRRDAVEAPAPTATRGRFPGHRDAVRRAAAAHEKEQAEGRVTAGPGPHGLPTAAHVNLDDVHPELLARMRAAYEAAPPSAREGFAVISGYRTNEQQAAAYARYLSGRGGIAARPGHSRHQFGQALDIHDPTGWFHRHGHEFGLHWPVRGDYPHTQMDPRFGRRLSDAQPQQFAGLGPGWGPFSDKPEEYGPPAPPTFAERWSPTSELPGQSFMERLEATGMPPSENVEDRRSDEDPYARMLATNQIVRKTTGNWKLSFDKPPPPRQAGRLHEEAGYYDIDKPDDKNK